MSLDDDWLSLSSHLSLSTNRDSPVNRAPIDNQQTVWVALLVFQCVVVPDVVGLSSPDRQFSFSSQSCLQVVVRVSSSSTTTTTRRCYCSTRNDSRRTLNDPGTHSLTIYPVARRSEIAQIASQCKCVILPSIPLWLTSLCLETASQAPLNMARIVHQSTTGLPPSLANYVYVSTDRCSPLSSTRPTSSRLLI